MSTDKITKICLSIGYPIKSSKSPSLHTVGYKALKIEDQFVYIRAEVKPEDLKDAISGVRGLGIRGVSVTMPHKETIIKLLDKLDNDAKKIKAVNTVLNENGKLIGYNTDWVGVVVPLEKRLKLKGKRVAVLGAGGAARAVVFGLTKKGAKVKIYNRTIEKAKALADEFKCEYESLSNLEDILKMDIIVNATSIGMNEDKSPLDKKYINNLQIVLDCVYSPLETKLLKVAKEKGATIIFGTEMLLYQAVEQFKLYTNLDAPVKAMRQSLL